MKKLLYLFLALALPGLIFVFLKMAGRNEFNIPVYYETGVTDSPCGITYPSPYSVPDSVRKRLGNEGRVMIVFFPLPDLELENPVHNPGHN
ncbi:MAG: hypothetical protein K2U26_03165, partial [Cyclobacteriaceae bacterium]|nr:hypothetical protein [Cyclobacteriaceae bacterium]